MKVGFAYLLTLSLVVPKGVVAQGYTSSCPTMYPYYCAKVGKCLANANACSAVATTSTTATQSQCANSDKKYWCAAIKRCMSNYITCANAQAAMSGTSGSGTQSSGSGTSSSSSSCPAGSSYSYWCTGTQSCTLSASSCQSQAARYTSFTGPTTLNCVENAYCKAYVASRGKCPNDSISMGSFYIQTNNGHYTIGQGCTVTCRGCTDSGTYIAPSGSSVASGYVYGGTNVNQPGGAPGGAGAGGGGGGDPGNNSVAINTPNGVACFNPNTGTTTYGASNGCGPQGGGGRHRKLRGAQDETLPNNEVAVLA